MSPSVDATHVLLDGPWRHRFVAANGARFHVAEAGDGPLVVLLHGFPQMWWCWRAQLPELAAAGYRAVAMDLRGYGASDKPPRGYDTPTLAADVAAVVRSLGADDAVVVGHDWGGWIAWAMPALEPGVTRAVAALAMAHPLTFKRAVRRRAAQARASRYILGFQLPIGPEHRLSRGDDTVQRMLRAGSGSRAWPGDDEAGREAIGVYTEAMQVPFVAHSAMEYYRWVVRSALRPDGRAFADRVDRAVTVPVLQLQGSRDPAILPQTARDSRDRVDGPYRYLELDAGHFLPEEVPDDVTAVLLDWLAGLP